MANDNPNMPGQDGYTQVYQSPAANQQAAYQPPVQQPQYHAPYQAPAQQPQYQAPYQAPVQQPQYQAPYQAPVQQPQYQAPYQAPVQQPQYQAPYQAPVQQPQYQAPAYQAPVYQAPAYPYGSAPSVPAAKRFPVAAVVMAGIGVFLYLLYLIIAEIDMTFMTALVPIGYAGLIVGYSMRNNVQLSSIITAVSCFIFTLVTFVGLVDRFDYIGDDFEDVLGVLYSLAIIATYALVGVYHILKGKLFGNPLKRILCIVCAGILFLQMIGLFASRGRWMSEEAIMLQIIITASDILLFMSLQAFTPYQKAE